MTMETVFQDVKKTLLQVIPNGCAQNWMMMIPCGISKYINENLN